MITDSSPILFARARCEDIDTVLRFHEEQATEFLWPRIRNDFERLSDEGALFIAYSINQHGGGKIIVGMCFVMEGCEEDERTVRWEFGGISVSNRLRGCGLGSALGKLAISSHYLMDFDRRGDSRLIAHVHEENDLPRRMLREHLGFEQKGQETPPSEVVPENLKRNPEGKVVGDLFLFNKAVLNSFADWLEAYSGQIQGKSMAVNSEIKIIAFNEGVEDSIETLRVIAKS